MSENTWKNRNGYLNSSNIIKKSGYYYAFIHVQDGYAGIGWNYLIRIANLANTAFRHGWDGRGFIKALQ